MMQKCIDRLQVIALTHPENLSVVLTVLDRMIIEHAEADANEGRNNP